MKKYAILLGTILLGLASALSYAQAPVPFINLPLVPDATPPGGSDFTLTVNGTGFVSTSNINWNGNALATQFVNQGQLTATVPAANIATASTGWVTVVTPAPGGGTSNTAFFTVTANEGNSVAFTLASSPPVGVTPAAVAVGDLNGDGKLDLAVVNWGSNTVSVLLGDGTGNFTPASSPTVGSGPLSVAVGDFNGDGKLDLAVANNNSSTVSVLLGDGTGNFTLVSSPPALYPRYVAVGDFNGDGKLDLAVVCSVGNVSILLGDGTGHFTQASSVWVGDDPSSVAVGDFNGDGKLDLAVTNEESNTVSVMLGDGTGNFTLASSPPVGVYPLSVAAGDFNGDGKLDLAVANDCGNDPSCSSPGTVSILLGDGTGNFTLASSPGGFDSPFQVAISDFNGDGNLDLAVANANGYTVSILLGDGTGSFALVSAPSVGDSHWSLAVGDFNGDGKLDFATVNAATNTVSVMLQAAPAVTLSPTSLTFGTQLVRTTSSTQTVTLTNTGVETLVITSITTNSTNFLEGNKCGSSLDPGANCTIKVLFKPHVVGTITGALTITDNAPNSPQTVPLTGVSTAVTLLPSSLNFGNQPVGSTSQPQTVTFTNYAYHALSINGVGFFGTNPGAFAQTNTCGTSVAAGASCTITVTFTPRGKGAKTATLEVHDNGGVSPQTAALNGAGT